MRLMCQVLAKDSAKKHDFLCLQLELNRRIRIQLFLQMWSIENIFEKSFSVQVMDQPVEQIILAQEHGTLAVVQTRKYIALWDIRSV